MFVVVCCLLPAVVDCCLLFVVCCMCVVCCVLCVVCCGVLLFVDCLLVLLVVRC